jgi:hypothetical protein
VFKLGLKDWKEIPVKVDEYALKHYIKVWVTNLRNENLYWYI